MKVCTRLSKKEGGWRGEEKIINLSDSPLFSQTKRERERSVECEKNRETPPPTLLLSCLDSYRDWAIKESWLFCLIHNIRTSSRLQRQGVSEDSSVKCEKCETMAMMIMTWGAWSVSCRDGHSLTTCVNQTQHILVQHNVSMNNNRHKRETDRG